MKASLVESIRSRGYWRVNFQPLRPAVNGPLSLHQCSHVVQSNAVRLRGWDYPHFPQRSADDSGLDRMNDYVQGWIDWSGHREFWRMYASSQYLHYRALYEDWTELEHLPASARRPTGIPDDKPLLGVVGNLWLIAEIVEFMSRLVTSGGLYEEGLRLSLQLHNGSTGRALSLDDPSRFGFSYARTTEAALIDFNKDLSAADVVEPRKLAIKAARHVFDRFGWVPADEQLESDISKLYKLR